MTAAVDIIAGKDHCLSHLGCYKNYYELFMEGTFISERSAGKASKKKTPSVCCLARAYFFNSISLIFSPQAGRDKEIFWDLFYEGTSLTYKNSEHCFYNSIKDFSVTKP